MIFVLGGAHMIFVLGGELTVKGCLLIRDLWNMDWIVRPNTSMPLVVHTSLPVEELGEQESELRKLHRHWTDGWVTLALEEASVMSGLMASDWRDTKFQL